MTYKYVCNSPSTMITDELLIVKNC